jgi:uncharacterized membrane protein YdcZ (DUF606 family)
MAVEPQRQHDLDRADAIGRKVGVGCFSAIVGSVSTAMIAILLSGAYAFLTRAPRCEGLPSCDWYRWALVGGVVGFVTLPILVIPRLGRPAAPPANSDRG